LVKYSNLLIDAEKLNMPLTSSNTTGGLLSSIVKLEKKEKNVLDNDDDETPDMLDGTGDQVFLDQEKTGESIMDNSITKEMTKDDGFKKDELK